MVAVEAQTAIPPASLTHCRTKRSSQVTIERRKVAGKQLRFNWDESEPLPPQSNAHTPRDTDQKATDPVNIKPVGSGRTEIESRANGPKAEVNTAPTSIRSSSASTTSRTSSSRIGETTKLGIVMFRLLKRYGITDEEIIEGLSMSSLS